MPAKRRFPLARCNQSDIFGIEVGGCVRCDIVYNTIINAAVYNFLIFANGMQGGSISHNLIYQSQLPWFYRDTFTGVSVGPNGWYSSASGGYSGTLARTGDRTGTDPGFVNLAGGDYHLVAGSAAVGLGAFP